MNSIYALGTFSDSGADGPSWPGVVRDGLVCPIAHLVGDAPADLGEIFADWGTWGARIDIAMDGASPSGWRKEAELVAQLPFKPENLYGAGANYRKHVMELIIDHGAGDTGHLSHEDRVDYAARLMDERSANGTPFAFIAPRSSIAGPEQPFLVPFDVEEPDWEFEMTAVIGKRGRRISADQAPEHIAGYTMANDITARELVSRKDLKSMGMDWLACKSSPGFKIIGPYITPARFIPDPQKLHLRFSLNGKVMQDEGTDDMIFSIARIVAWISMHCELQPGDMIMTGSPSGNGTHYGRFIKGGDEMHGEIDGLVGAQIVQCVAEKQPVADGVS